MKKRHIYLLITLLYACELSAQQNVQPQPNTRKNSIYFQVTYLGLRGKPGASIGPFTDNGSDTPFGGYGFAAISYERLCIQQQHFMASLAAGFTPPINDEVKFAYHIGPKLYFGEGRHWLSLDVRYCGIFSKHARSSIPKGQVESLTSYGRYAGLGYYLRGRRGFYLNPSLILCQDNYDRNKLNLYGGLNMCVGYSF
ncbi:MAG: hypothetical protein IT262_10670 [Saprospiraceae bacterium]|nr:hypothetical protein [Saprospiraceae bacterium]